VSQVYFSILAERYLQTYGTFSHSIQLIGLATSCMHEHAQFSVCLLCFRVGDVYV